MTRGGRGARDRLPLGLAMTACAGVGVVASSYLAITKLSGTPPVCGPVQGCETVESSAYSAIFGIPVAVFGLGMILVVLACALRWWRTGDRRAILVSYGLGILGLFVVVYLAYLMVFVIRAFCIWCATFDASLVLGWLLTVVALRQPVGEPA